VLDRGDRREPTLLDEEDRRVFVATLGEVCAKTRWQLRVFSLMANRRRVSTLLCPLTTSAWEYGKEDEG